MRRFAQRFIVALIPLVMVACSNPVAPAGGAARVVAPAASATRDVIVDSPECRSGYNVTQGRCE